MTSCAALMREFCEKCDDTTVHDSVGCIHCRSPRRPPPVANLTAHFTEHFNAQPNVKARKRIARHTARIKAGAVPGTVARNPRAMTVKC